MHIPIFKTAASAVAILCFLLLMAGSGDDDKDTQDTQAKPVEYTLSASELYAAYDNNEVAADAKYKGKVVVVSGTISDIGKDIVDDAYVMLSVSDNSFSGVQCFFTEGEQGVVGSLAKGQQITIKGEVDGMLGNVFVRKCRIQ